MDRNSLKFEPRWNKGVLGIDFITETKHSGWDGIEFVTLIYTVHAKNAKQEKLKYLLMSH